jgi:phage-related minor tail protein
MIRELESKELDKDDAQIAIENQKLDNINAKIRKAKMEASALHQVQHAFRDSFESSMATAFQSIIEGTSNMKDAFLSMTKSILSAMAQVLAQQAAIAIMGSIPFFPGGGLGGRDGGVMKSPGYRSFGTGGVSDGPDSGYPAMLHGTEAVVPLPNGRSIPVEMSGGMGGNNISVNVNMTTGETSSTGGGEQAYALGRAISTAVQTELEKQQRPGGTLSPY